MVIINGFYYSTGHDNLPTYVIDDADAGTSRALNRSGLGGHTIAMTNDLTAYNNMRSVPGMRKLYVATDAGEFYATADYEKHVVVVHDGNQTAENAMPQLKKLLARKHKTICLVVNVAARSNGHHNFRYDLAKCANRYGYSAECRLDATYRQLKTCGTKMHTFCFILRARQCVMVDLT